MPRGKAFDTAVIDPDSSDKDIPSYLGYLNAFAVCGWLAGRGVVWPLILPWLPAMGAFVWSIQDESAGFMEGGLVFLAILAYLLAGFAGSIVMYFDARAGDRKRRGAA